MTEAKKEKSVSKIWPVIKVLFSTASKKYPMFFVLEAFKTLVEIMQPFLGIIISPLLVDELCTSRNIKTLVTYATILILGECVLILLVERCNMTLQKYQMRMDNYFSMLLGERSMGLDFQLTEDKAALDQLEKAKTGMTWYSGGVYGVSEQVFMFIGNVVKIVGFVTLILMHAPWLLLVIVGYIAINSFITSKRNSYEIIAFNRLSRTNRLFGYFGWNIIDFRYGKDIRLYDAADMMTARWNKNTDESISAWKWQADKTYSCVLISSALSLIKTIFTYYYVGRLAILKVFSVGVFTQMISAASALDATLGGLVWNILELQKRCNYAYEYVLFMDYPEALPKGNKTVKDGEHRIEFKDVSFAYPGTEKLILDHINITIEPGEHLSIVGLNGAGKTTFIKLLCRLYDPTEGSILLDGVDIREYDYKDYMRQFAPVFQDFKLFCAPVKENITLKENDEAELAELWKLVELEDFVDKLPKGEETCVYKFFDEEGVEPSGGEQQKMAIARALYKKSPVVILDEPTAALDPIAEYEIYKQFHTLVGGKTAFYISHRLSSCKFCDKIAVFSDGKIAEYGNHDKLVSIVDGIYAKMFEAQAQYYR